ncbi:MAG: reductive dehalogenase [Dehalococcoides mccartyi]|uniref:reductive dehalogenase n=1 Tax=Dehalococcoides mccartyi TaxID=61435 RepID=UPI0030F8373E
MNKFHTSLSRRDFMKGLGLASAGIGAVAAVSPVFHDLDEVVSADSSVNKRPWWIKEVDSPTIEIDWAQVTPLGQPSEGCHLSPILAQYVGEDRVQKATADGDNAVKNGISNGISGLSLRDDALNNASSPHFMYHAKWKLTEPTPGIFGANKTPGEKGVSRWEGTPEENFALLKSAMRFFGAGRIASIELDSNIKKLLYPIDASQMFFGGGPMAFKFEDVDEGYTTDTHFVIPNKAKWVVTYTTPMPKELYRTAPSAISNAGNMSRYRLNGETIACIQHFMNGIGYQALQSAPFPNGICASPATATLSGLGEMNRINQTLIPEEGSVVGLYKFITDLPLPVTKPVDCGVFRFCHTCRKCADTCPSSAISFNEDPSWEPPGAWSTSGKRAYFKQEPECKLFQNSSGCSCQVCTGTCVFNVNNVAMIHNVVRGIVSTTPIFNSFLASADKFFGYAQHDAAEWWDLDLPRYGFDTTMGVRDGGYGK